LWLVFDTPDVLSLAAIAAEAGGGIVKSAAFMRQRGAAIVRVALERPKLVSVGSDGTTWTVMLANEVIEPTRPLAMSRNIGGTARSSITIPIDDPRDLHRLDDPDAGDALLVVTALGPARGFIKIQDFVEFRALASSHGVVVQPLADDLSAELATDKILITRPAGLTLSAAASGARNPTYQRYVLDPQSWGFDRQAEFGERSADLILAAAAATESKRAAARADLARFYLARDMAAEAKAVLDVALADSAPIAENPAPLILRAVANIMLGRMEPALKDLANPIVGGQHEAPLWRALAQARLGRFAEAREGFRNAEPALGTLPLEMQRFMLKEMIRAFIEVGDITGAVAQFHEFETVGIPRELEPALSVLAGRIAEGLGRIEDARRSYQAAADSWDRPAAAQGRLREIVLQHARGAIKPIDAIGDLETLTAIWRGDETEVEGLQLLARLYADAARYRDAFHVMRTALAAHPNAEMTRRIRDEAAASFEDLFLSGKGDSLPAIDALALFYDFRELTPIGRRGDEMIRRLADRLVSVDLLDQAAELLQHQVDHRLQGAARAQIASRLAVIYLMDHKADRALATLRATRINDLSNEVRNQRLLLEARALSQTGRHDVALEVIGNISGREVVRLRSDIHWAAQRWREAAEQIEVLYGERWQEFEPLADTERSDILRAAIGYALAADAIGLTRFREKYLAKIGDGPDRRAFEVVTAPVGNGGSEFREIARSIASIDTLESFLRDLRARYPETGALPSGPGRAPRTEPPPTTGTPPARPPSGRTASG
jgi:tetratricopeptide (TPR) repeat protein